MNKLQRALVRMVWRYKRARYYRKLRLDDAMKHRRRRLEKQLEYRQAVEYHTGVRLLKPH